MRHKRMARIFRCRFFASQRGLAMPMVLTVVGLSVPLIVASLGMAGALSNDSQVKTEILKRQYNGQGVREYVDTLWNDPPEWQALMDNGGQGSVNLNGETTNFIASEMPPAIADDSCYPSLAGTSVSGNLVVKEGTTCTLFKTDVEGNVKVEENAALGVVGSTIGGNIQADGSSWLFIDCSGPGCSGGVSGPVVCSNVFRNSTGCSKVSSTNAITTTVINGNVQIDDITGVPPGYSANFICNGTHIGGNLQMDNNQAPFEVGGRTICDALGVGTSGNTIDGNLQVANNTDTLTGGPAAEISDNTVGQDLQCSGNTLDVTGEAGSNTVTGDKKDECLGL